MHDDSTVEQIRGSYFPISPLHERVLCLLSIRYVDEIIMGAPWQITKDLLKTFNVAKVAHVVLEKPTETEINCRKLSTPYSEENDPYEVPKQLQRYYKIEV